MRILMLAQFYPPTIGGEEHHVHNLSIELTRRGYDVSVATLWKEGLPEYEDDHGVHIHRIRGSMQRISSLFTQKERRHMPPFSDPEALIALRRLILYKRPDIVHAHNWMLHSFTPLKAWSGAKLVVTLHDCGLVCTKHRFEYRKVVCNGANFIKCLDCSTEHYGFAKGVPIIIGHRIWQRVAYKTVDMFLPVSQSVAEKTRLDKHNLPYHVIPNFISDTFSTSTSETDPIDTHLPQENYLLFVGMVGHGKGVEVLLQAYANMQSSVPLVLIGQPQPDFSMPLPSNVHLLGSWPHSSVMHAWKRSLIALTPSIDLDPFPTVTLEAMSMGCPVIASHIGGLPDIVEHGKTGLLVAPGDVHALQSAIQHLLDDSLLRERMGTRGKQRVVQFQASSVVPRIEQIYQEVLQS